MKLPGAMRQKYEDFINEGSLHVLEGTILDMMEVLMTSIDTFKTKGWT
jgi:hypothetical protein